MFVRERHDNREPGPGWARVCLRREAAEIGWPHSTHCAGKDKARTINDTSDAVTRRASRASCASEIPSVHYACGRYAQPPLPPRAIRMRTPRVPTQWIIRAHSSAEPRVFNPADQATGSIHPTKGESHEGKDESQSRRVPLGRLIAPIDPSLGAIRRVARPCADDASQWSPQNPKRRGEPRESQNSRKGRRFPLGRLVRTASRRLVSVSSIGLTAGEAPIRRDSLRNPIHGESHEGKDESQSRRLPLERLVPAAPSALGDSAQQSTQQERHREGKDEGQSRRLPLERLSDRPVPASTRFVR